MTERSVVVSRGGRERLKDHIGAPGDGCAVMHSRVCAYAKHIELYT